MEVGEYIGIPYRVHGRDRTGCDCWGLARLVLGERRGVWLPSFAGDYGGTDFAHRHELARLIDVRRPLVAVSPVSAPEVGDIVLMRLGGQPCHVGLVTGPGRMLHIEQDLAAIIERYDGHQWGRRVDSFWRVGA